MRLSAFLRASLALSASLALAASLCAQSTCQPQWLPTFGGRPGTDNPVHAFAHFDDGSGDALYVGGNFLIAGGESASAIARWSGTQWTSVGGGVTGSGTLEVDALCVFDDGSGPALFVGGSFTSAGGVPASRIAKWDGQQWTALGSGVNSYVYALCVFDDGSGPALYVAGWSILAGGQPANSIARWNGSSWSAVGGGMNGVVNALAVFDDGSGAELYAGGSFSLAGGQPASGMAKWNGTSWSTLGAQNLNGTAALCVHDDGSGSALYAGGYFNLGSGGPAQRIAKWDGSSWSAVGLGMDYRVLSLAEFDDGSGNALYAGGEFSFADGLPASGMAKWDGQHWSALAVPLSSATVNALCVFDDGQGAALFSGGAGYVTSSGRVLNNVGKWSGVNWSSLGDGNDWVTDAVEVFDDGTGPALFVSATKSSPTQQRSLRRWNGSSWSNVAGAPSDGVMSSLLSFDHGGGAVLIVAGSFTTAGGAPANGIAQYDGSSWSPLGSGLSGVTCLCAHDDGSGPALYAAGDFLSAGGVPALRIAKWNGSSWSALGGGLGSTYGYVLALLSFDDGSGSALYAAGAFAQAGGASANNLAKWQGGAWTTLGSGTNAHVSALAAFDDGSGPALYAGGWFSYAGGQPASGLAKWNGLNWSALGSGLDGGLAHHDAFALVSHDDGNGPLLYVGGDFTAAGGVPAANLAAWDGAQWTSVGGGMSDWVKTLDVWDDGGGAALFAGGLFVSCYDSGDSFLAKRGIPTSCWSPGLSICEPGSAGVSACPCANPPSGAGRGCDNSSATGGAQLTASGAARVSNDTLLLATSGEKPTATSVVLQGDALSASGTGFGQGVRCVTGSLKRLYVKTAVGGSIGAPGAGDASISARSAALGAPITQGVHRYYGVYYRDPTVLGGCLSTNTYNITQQLDVLWYP